MKKTKEALSTNQMMPGTKVKGNTAKGGSQPHDPAVARSTVEREDRSTEGRGVGV